VVDRRNAANERARQRAYHVPYKDGDHGSYTEEHLLNMDEDPDNGSYSPGEYTFAMGECDEAEAYIISANTGNAN
jgi:hypothetical protein